MYMNHGYGMQVRGSYATVTDNRFYNNLVNNPALGSGDAIGGSVGGGFNFTAGQGDPTAVGNVAYNNLSYNNGYALTAFQGLSPGQAFSGTTATGVLNLFKREWHARLQQHGLRQ